MVSKTLLENLTKSFSCDRRKNLKKIEGTFTTTQFKKRKFILTIHAKERMKERGVSEFDGSKLGVSKKPKSNVFKNDSIEKKILDKNNKSLYVYWTDGFFTFVTVSEKAGVYIVITVV